MFSKQCSDAAPPAPRHRSCSPSVSTESGTSETASSRIVPMVADVQSRSWPVFSQQSTRAVSTSTIFTIPGHVAPAHVYPVMPAPALPGLAMLGGGVQPWRPWLVDAAVEPETGETNDPNAPVPPAASLDCVRRMLLSARGMPQHPRDLRWDRTPNDRMRSTGPYPTVTFAPSRHSAFHAPRGRSARRVVDTRPVARVDIISGAARALRIVASVATRRLRLGSRFSTRRLIDASGGIERHDARQVFIAAYFALTDSLGEDVISQSEFAALIHCFSNTFSDWRYEYYREHDGPARFWATVAPDSTRFAAEIIAYLRAGHPAPEATMDDFLASPLRDRLTQGGHGGTGR